MKIFNALTILIGSSLIFGAVSCNNKCIDIVKPTPKVSDLKVEPKAIEIRAGQNQEYNILQGSGKYKVLSLSNDLLESNIKDSKIFLEAKNPGRTSIGVFDLISNQSVKIPVTILDRLPALTISRRTINMLIDTKDSVKIITGSGDYSTEIENPEVLSAEIKNGYLYITSLKEGDTGITFKDNMTNQSINLNVRVTKPAEKPKVALTTDKDVYEVIEGESVNIKVQGSGKYSVTVSTKKYGEVTTPGNQGIDFVDGKPVYTISPTDGVLQFVANYGKGAGSVKVTITDLETGNTKDITVNVSEEPEESGGGDEEDDF